MKSDYVIDFERINQLTTSIYDDPNDKTNPFSNGKFAFSVSRKIILNYLEQFQNLRSREEISDEMSHVLDTMEFQKVQ
jgi:hypothetical protein